MVCSSVCFLFCSHVFWFVYLVGWLLLLLKYNCLRILASLISQRYRTPDHMLEMGEMKIFKALNQLNHSFTKWFTVLKCTKLLTLVIKGAKTIDTCSMVCCWDAISVNPHDSWTLCPVWCNHEGHLWTLCLLWKVHRGCHWTLSLPWTSNRGHFWNLYLLWYGHGGHPWTFCLLIVVFSSICTNLEVFHSTVVVFSFVCSISVVSCSAGTSSSTLGPCFAGSVLASHTALAPPWLTALLAYPWSTGLLPLGLALHPFPLSTSTHFILKSIWKLLFKDGGSLFCRTFVVLLANLITSWMFTCVSCMSVTPVYISPCDPYVHCLVLSTVGCIIGCFQFYFYVFWFVFWSVYFGLYYYY